MSAAVDRIIDDLLPTVRRIAVVGLSDNPGRTSHAVARVLQTAGYEIVPVNPTVDQVLGEVAYPSLAAIPGPVDLVDVFRRPEHLAGVAREAAAAGAPAIWNQLGLVSDEARAIAAAAGMTYVEDRCLKVEVQRRRAIPSGGDVRPRRRSPEPDPWRRTDRTTIMGIVNLNGDSFSDPRAAVDVEERVAAAMALVADGADVVDLGAQSAALSAMIIPHDRQVELLVPVTSALAAAGVAVSVDTDVVGVAEAVLVAGARVINDFSGQPTQELIEVVAASGADYVLTHNPLGLRVRQDDRDAYDDVVQDVIDGLRRDLDRLSDWGLISDRVVLDPGVDAGKTPAQTLALLRGRDRVREAFDQHLLWAISRKDVLGAITGRPPRERDPATHALFAAIGSQPRTVVRVHDVAAARDVLLVGQALRGERDLDAEATLPDELRRSTT